MSSYYIAVADKRFDPTWLEFEKPIFIAGYGYVGSVSLDGKTPDRADRPSVAGCSKTPDGWLVWMGSGAAALVPETNIKYVGCALVQGENRQREVEAEGVSHETLPDQPPEMRFAHLPDGVRDKIIAQAKGGHAGDAPLAQIAQAMNSGMPVASEPVKKRRGRPPKVRSSEAAGPST